MPENEEVQYKNLIDSPIVKVNADANGEPANVQVRLVSVQTDVNGKLPAKTILYKHGDVYTKDWVSNPFGNAHLVLGLDLDTGNRNRAVLCKDIEHLNASGEPEAGIVDNVAVIIGGEVDLDTCISLNVDDPRIMYLDDEGHIIGYGEQVKDYHSILTIDSLRLYSFAEAERNNPVDIWRD
ncbi:hypothetical protein IJT93_10305 [bacterium]|nr:hypothetical protein [bacterium]